ncbi:MAG: hypothetical protein M0Z31_06940 [Clostridia bacterium]|nr:hypothetical protein [Clostridia bacterium]
MNRPYGMSQLSRFQWLGLAFILILALVSRLWWVAEMSPRTLTHDEIGYNAMTEQFLDKGFLGYYADVPNAFVTPGYPLFLATVYKSVDLAAGKKTDPLPVVRVIQTFISVATVFLVFVLGLRTGRVGVAFLAAVFITLYPPNFSANTRILTEVLYTFLLLAYVYSVMSLFDKRTPFIHGLTGVLLALVVLVRPAVAPLLILPYLLDFWRHRDWRFASGVMVAGLCFSLIMLPWWVRNYVVMNQVVVFATQSGNPFLRGTDPYDPYDKIGPSIIENVAPEDQMRVGMERVKKGVQTEPGLWVEWFTVGKFTYLWGQPWGLAKGWLQGIHVALVVILGWLGVVRALFSPRLRWLAVIPVFMTLLQMAFIPITRYMYPLTPIMLILAAVLVMDIVERFRGNNPGGDDDWKVQYMFR